MNWFDKIKKYYDKGMYTDQDVKTFVECGKITPEEFTLITGVEYIA